MNLKFCIVLFFSVCMCFSHVRCNKDEKSLYDVVQTLKKWKNGIRDSQRAENIELDLKHYSSDPRNFQLEIFNTLLGILKDSSNSTCTQDVLYVAEHIKMKDLMNSSALQMLDSFGKPESGLLKGNFKWIGDFDECRNVHFPMSNGTNGFHGKYCTLAVTAVNLPLSIGICVPETCDPSNFFPNHINVSAFQSMVQVNSLTCKENTRKLSGAAIATICVMSIFGVLAFLGSSITVAEYLISAKHARNPECEQEKTNSIQTDNDEVLIMEGSRTKLSVFVEESSKFLNCFCLFTNGAKLLSVGSTEGQLLCLHGIRFLSMSWVILCHTYIFPVAVIRSMADVTNKVDSFAFQAILNGFFSVDSFFLLSGFLLAYLYFQEAAKKKGEIPWLYFYIHRYVRLTPVYMIVLAFSTTVYPYISTGPFWPDYTIEPNCQEYWWWNMLYINNLKDSALQCFGWSWYLANDMQFFVVSPLFLISLWRWPKIGYGLIGLFLCGNWISTFVLTYHFELPAGGMGDVTKIATDPTFMIKWADFFSKIYVKPYTRDAPYLIGIVLAYILFKRKITHFNINKMTVWIGWVSATVMGLACVYGLYHQYPGLVGASIYNAFTRTAFALSLGWLIFACLSGYGGPVDKILSYKLFIPLSRLTYCAYLIHPLVISAYSMSLRETLVFTHFTMVTLFLGLILISYALSLLVSLLFESPIIRLEKYIRGKFNKQKS